MTEAAFVFADLAGYTALTDVHGDDDAADVATTFHDLAKSCLGEGARLVKTIGDAVMVVAPSNIDEIAFAIVLARCISTQPTFPAVRIGIHSGPAVERDQDYFGATVNIAARVAALARGGEIVCTEMVAAVAVEHGLASARPMGTVRLKNVAAPVALYELTDAEGIERGELRHVDPVCRMQVTADEARALVVQDGATFYFCSPSCAAKFESAPERYVALASD